MLEVCSPTWKQKGKAKEKLELWFGDLLLIGMKIVKIKCLNDTNYNITMQVGIKHRKSRKCLACLVTGQVVCETGTFSENINGRWYVKPLTMLKALGVYRKIFINPDAQYGIDGIKG
jgi:hypothetical protein